MRRIKNIGFLFLPMAAVVFGARQAFAQDAIEFATVPAKNAGTRVWPLMAGQSIDVGTVTVENDLDNLHVTYVLTCSGATFDTLQMWVGSDFDLLPKNNDDIPVPGQFCQASGG